MKKVLMNNWNALTCWAMKVAHALVVFAFIDMYGEGSVRD